MKTKETEDETRNKLPINHQDNFDLNTVPLNSGTTYVRHHFLTYFKISRKLCCSCLLDLRALISIIKYFLLKNLLQMLHVNRKMMSILYALVVHYSS